MYAVQKDTEIKVNSEKVLKVPSYFRWAGGGYRIRPYRKYSYPE